MAPRAEPWLPDKLHKRAPLNSIAEP
jgi:hypothetical protein